MKQRLATTALAAGFCMFAAQAFALDFHGATVNDYEVPSSYLRVGLFGNRPVVDAVAPASPAARAGLQQGDILVAIDGSGLRRAAELAGHTAPRLVINAYRAFEKKTLTIEGTGGTARPPAPSPPKPLPAINHTPERRVQPAPPQPLPASTAATAAAAPSVPAAPAPPARQNTVGNSPPTSGTPQTSTPPRPVPAPPSQGVKPTLAPPAASPRQTSPPSAAPPASATPKGDLFNRQVKPAQDRILFENSKGQVTFSHSSHLRNLNKAQCLLCHQVENPTHESIQSRLDDHRAAHAFCRGCHQKTGRGPVTECTACHKGAS